MPLATAFSQRAKLSTCLEPRFDALPQARFRRRRRRNRFVRNDFGRLASRRLRLRRLWRHRLVRQHIRRLRLWRLLVVRRRFRRFDHWRLDWLRRRLDWLRCRLDRLWTFPIAGRMRKKIRHDAIRCKHTDSRHHEQAVSCQYVLFLHRFFLCIIMIAKRQDANASESIMAKSSAEISLNKESAAGD